jgi:hypothetical protein
LNPRQALEKDPERSPRREIVLTREAGEFDGVRRGAREVTAQVMKTSRFIDTGISGSKVRTKLDGKGEA